MYILSKSKAPEYEHFKKVYVIILFVYIFKVKLSMTLFVMSVQK